MAEVLIIADVHLAPANRAALQPWQALMRRAAKADGLYLLGDLFDYWVGDDQPIPAEIGAALDELAALPCPKFFISGNRDFLIGQELLDRMGAKPLPDVATLSINDHKLVLCHGDTLCTDDVAYQAMRQQLRSPAFRCDFLSKPLDERLAIALSLRAKSRTESSSKPEDIMDVNPAAVRALLKAEAAVILLHGHTHRPAIHREASGITRIVTGDWGAKGWLIAITPEQITLECFTGEMTEIVDTLKPAA
ncbi:MAG: UDP-2,3-diacylglucosamine diphosphatase [Halothiobacillus sp. 20-53-49]|nr:MAG: UDP-2,3-diacylglucosamine diphosphatase [Halothiobacillus sp. 20-53-49]HUM99976.1 UDP-2,3-diacylglucosamine diphosphatase [Halothiobacillus sp.]